MKNHRRQNSRRTRMSNVRFGRSSMSKVRFETTSMSSVSETTGASWSKLPEDLLCLVVDRILNVKDFFMFRSVCKDWRSTIPRSYHKYTPWLLAKRYKASVVVLKGLCSLRPGDNISLSSLFDTELHWRYWGSFTGWILGQHTSDYRLKLINPLTKAVIDLPRLCHRIRKGLVYHTPGSGSIGIMAISHSLNGVALIDSEYKDWTILADVKGVRKSNFVDLVWYKDNLVALRANGALVFFKEATEARPLDPEPVIVWGLENYDQLYLVESSGDLLIVTHRFQVYRLNLDTGDWIQVKDLGRHSLFVGNSYSMSCLIPDDETEDSWRPSCIYNATYSSTSWGNLSCYNIKKRREEFQHLGPVPDLDKCYDFIWYMPAAGSN